ncbi:MAG: hypothetical protein MK207_14510, partial [Saprospiraceae bacterium]|nr:hypothetical protein [Saprospiraceae bacterium]
MKNVSLLVFFVALLFTINVSAQVGSEDDGMNTTTKNENKELVFKNGFFLDGIYQFGTLANYSGYPNTNNRHDYSLNISARAGHKWYFGNMKAYRPGISVIWMRAGFNHYQRISIIPEPVPFFNPLNIGITNMFRFSDKTGLQVNINGGYSFVIGVDYAVYHSYLINPNIKIIINKFVLGIDIS